MIIYISGCKWMPVVNKIERLEKKIIDTKNY